MDLNQIKKEIDDTISKGYYIDNDENISLYNLMEYLNEEFANNEFKQKYYDFYKNIKNRISMNIFYIRNVLNVNSMWLDKNDEYSRLTLGFSSDTLKVVIKCIKGDITYKITGKNKLLFFESKHIDNTINECLYNLKELFYLLEIISTEYNSEIVYNKFTTNTIKKKISENLTAEISTSFISGSQSDIIIPSKFSFNKSNIEQEKNIKDQLDFYKKGILQNTSIEITKLPIVYQKVLERRK